MEFDKCTRTYLSLFFKSIYHDAKVTKIYKIRDFLAVPTGDSPDSLLVSLSVYRSVQSYTTKTDNRKAILDICHL